MIMEDNKRQDDLMEELNKRMMNSELADDDVLIPEGSMPF